MRKSFKLATIFGIPIEINVTWFIIVGLVIFTLAQGYFPYTNPNLPSGLHWLMATVSALLLFASLLAHELAHALVARKNNLPIHGITLFIFGGVAQMDKEPATPAVEFKMAIAGPIMSFCLAGVFGLTTQISYYLGVSPVFLAITNYLFILNIVIGVFNLIPGFPLDGGRVLRSILWAWLKDVRKATAIATSIGKAFALVLMALGLLNLLQGGLISGIWFIFIGLFLHEAADSSYRQVAMKKLLSGVKVETLMAKTIISIPADISLDKLVDDYFFRYRHATFPVMAEDTILGLVTLHDIKEVPKDKWPNTLAKEIMLPLSSAIVIDRHADILEALAKAASNGLGRLLVVEHNKLVGILSQRDILKMFEYKAEIGA